MKTDAKSIPGPEIAVVGEIIRDCLLTRTRRISRVLTNLYDNELKEHGVNAPQFSLLVLIAKLDGASRAEISRTNYQDRSTMTRNLALLLEQGWIEEKQPLGGGRRIPIVISDAGKKVLASAAPSWRSAQEKAERILGESGVDAIVEVADSIPLERASD